MAWRGCTRKQSTTTRTKQKQTTGLGGAVKPSKILLFFSDFGQNSRSNF